VATACDVYRVCLISRIKGGVNHAELEAELGKCTGEREAQATLPRLIAIEAMQRSSLIESAIAGRGADVYASFLLPHLRPDALILDCGCGKATIALGLAEALPAGRVVGVDLAEDGLADARRYAASIERNNLACVAADGRRLPFCDAAFEAVLCHSMLETLDDPANVVAELGRVTKRGGVVGAASVDYGGLILAGEQTAGPQRFYDIRQQLWRAAGTAEPNMGRRLRGLFQEAGFGRVEAFADYISYGTPDQVMTFARGRAAECSDEELRAAIACHGIASAEELTDLAASWEEWGKDPGAFFAFAWCRVLAWP
jgi:SAM-dependent methyltransferase